MTRVAFTLKIRDDLIDEYRRRHQEVWPEMKAALRRHGWRNYSLFLHTDGTLFGYLETPSSLTEALDGMSDEEVNARWQEAMAPFFSGDGQHADRMMEELVEVFHLD
ncbi:MAG: L-rhamnose mutarotase [Actinobacteria bacterium]|nr:L-rhamnose mutarotase [Actinomycetota bacterium]